MADGGKVVIKVDADDKDFKKASTTWGKIGGTALKGVAVGAAAVATAVGTIGVSAIKAYGEYEQLVGGVETLFKESSGQVLNYANNAYKTAGLSANEYMSTVTSFSASLLQSLDGDTAKASETANQAITDMSDNANKMGTSMEMIQNAYQGFAKQNYTMLDNLKLGYGGTKTEMERLIADANKVKQANGEMADLSINSFADVTEAIHIIQTEMGITGTTALEASTTIQGSFGMLQSAWENLMIGMTDPSQDIDVLLQNVVDSLNTFIANLLPRIEALLPSIATAITTLAPMLIQTITNLIPVLLPVIVDGIQSLADALIGAFPVIIDALLSNLPMIIETALQIVVALAMGIADSLPELIPTIVDTVLLIVETLIDNIDMLIDASIAIILGLADGLLTALPRLIEKVPDILFKLVDALIENAPKLMEASWQLLFMLGKGLIDYIKVFLDNIPKFFKNAKASFIKAFEKIKDVGKNIVEGIWNGISGSYEWIKNKIKGWVGNVTSFLKNLFGIHSPSTVMRDQIGKFIALGLAVGIDKNSKAVISSAKAMGEKTIEAVKSSITDNRSEVQKVMDSFNETLLESEQKYNEESERLKDSKEEADKAYLESLKETAEKERKIYDAQLKDIENYKKSVVDAYTDLANEAFDKIEEVQKLQEDFAGKLNDSINLYEEVEDTQGNKKFKLADIGEQTEALKLYAENLQKLKNRGNIPKEFFNIIRDMSVEEGTNFVNALLQANDEKFDTYIEQWKEQQAVADVISKELYADETEEALKEVGKEFEDFNKDLDTLGVNNGESWASAFASEVRSQLRQLKDEISMSFGSLMSTSSLGLAMAGGGTSNTYNTYNEMGPIKVESALQLDGRTLGRTTFDVLKQEMTRRGVTTIR